MNRWFKAFSITVALSIFMGTMAGCGSKDQTTESSTSAANSVDTQVITTETCGMKDGKFVYPNSPLEFSMMWMYDWWTPTNSYAWGEDEVSKYIEKTFNVKINQVGSEGDPKEKLNVLIASKSLPDVLVMDRGADWKKVIQSGSLVAIDDYIEKYPAYKSKISDQTLNAYRQDGKLYGMLNWATSENHPMGNGGYALNTKIYKELGSPKLETLDELYNYLLKIKESGIKVDGKDIVPFQGDTRCDSPLDKFIFRSAFGDYNPGLNPHYLSNVDGKLTYYLNDAKWVNTLLYVNKLYREGLINSDVFIEKTDQMEEKLANGRVGLFCSGADMVDPVAKGRQSWKAADPAGDYVTVEPFSTEGVAQDKVWTSSYSTMGWNVICITKNAKDPERIHAYFDWVFSDEGQLITFNGPKGEIWNELDQNGYPIFTKSRYELSTEEQNRVGFETYTNPGFADFVDFAKVAGNNRLPAEKQDWVINAQSKITWPHSINNTQYEDISPDPSSEEGVLEEMIKQTSDNQYLKIALAKSEAEAKALIEDTIKKVYDAGFEKLEKIKNEKWQANVAKMNSK